MNPESRFLYMDLSRRDNRTIEYSNQKPRTSLVIVCLILVFLWLILAGIPVLCVRLAAAVSPGKCIKWMKRLFTRWISLRVIRHSIVEKR